METQLNKAKGMIAAIYKKRKKNPITSTFVKLGDPTIQVNHISN